MTRNGQHGVSTLGVVSFLNAQPLIEGLDGEAGIKLHFAVPAALPGMLEGGQVDVALIPVIDLAAKADVWEQISDACIGSDGETLTVRVFSKVPPEKITSLYVDNDSHTSVVLARLIWLHQYEQRLKLAPLADVVSCDECESVLLIGDKVVDVLDSSFEYQIDLGQAWKEWTGLPFVFAVWAVPSDVANNQLAALLNEARDRGVARASAIAAEVGPELGWPIELATEYLTQRLFYKLTPAALEGMNMFIELATEEGIIERSGELAR